MFQGNSTEYIRFAFFASAYVVSFGTLWIKWWCADMAFCMNYLEMTCLAMILCVFVILFVTVMWTPQASRC